jgi:hypothetical protein
MPEAAIPPHIERWIVEHVDWVDPLFADGVPVDDDATHDKEPSQ